MSLFPRTTLEAALDRVSAALRDVLALDRDQRDALAKSLIEVAARFGVPIDPELLGWIHFEIPGKLWSEAEWERWCVKYTDLQRSLAAYQSLEDRAIETRLEARVASMARLCPSCVEIQLQVSEDGLWICANCGFLAPRETDVLSRRGSTAGD